MASRRTKARVLAKPQPTSVKNHIVARKTAEKLLAGHPAYIAALRREYVNANDAGSFHAIIHELETTCVSEQDFDSQLFQVIEEMESTESRFVLLAVVGTNPTESHWG